MLYTGHLVNVDYRAPILALNDGFRLAFLIAAGFAATGALVAFRLIPRSVRPPGPQAAPPPAAAQAAPADRSARRLRRPGPPTPAPRRPRWPRPRQLRPLPPRPRAGAPAALAREPRAVAARSDAAAPLQPPMTPRPRTPRAPARVTVSLSGGGRWALGGSMTITLAGEGGAARDGRRA